MKEYLSYSCVKHNNRIVFFNKEIGYVSVDDEIGLTELVYTEASAANFAIMEIGNEIYAFSNGNAKIEQIDGNKIIELPQEVSRMYANDYITSGEFWGLLFGNDLLICGDYNGDIKAIHLEELLGSKIKYVGKTERYMIFWIPGCKLIIYDVIASRIERQISISEEIEITSVFVDEKIYILADKGVYYISENNTLSQLKNDGVNFKQYGRIHIFDKKIVLLPWEISKNESIVMIDLGDYSVEKYINYPADFIISDKLEEHPYVRYCIKNQNIYYPTRCSNYILVINRAEGIKWIKADYSNEQFENSMIKNMFKRNKVIYETNEKSLERFIHQTMVLCQDLEQIKMGDFSY